MLLNFFRTVTIFAFHIIKIIGRAKTDPITSLPCWSESRSSGGKTAAGRPY